jgi:hypothetical protein
MLIKTQIRISFGSPIHSLRHFTHRNPESKPANTAKGLILSLATAALILGIKVALFADSDPVFRPIGTDLVPTIAAAAAAISFSKTSAACIPGTFPGLRTAPSSKPPDLHTHTASTPPGLSALCSHTRQSAYINPPTPGA